MLDAPDTYSVVARLYDATGSFLVGRLGSSMTTTISSLATVNMLEPKCGYTRPLDQIHDARKHRQMSQQFFRAWVYVHQPPSRIIG